MPTRGVLVIVTLDPETSPRAAEAIRIALGLVAAESDVTIALLGPAAKVLDSRVEAYVDGEEMLRHVTTLRQLGQVFRVERQAFGSLADGTATGGIGAPIGSEELADLIARSDRVICF